MVGEDRGTVEERVRQAMHERNILSSKVFWFETDEPANWPELARTGAWHCRISSPT